MDNGPNHQPSSIHINNDMATPPATQRIDTATDTATRNARDELAADIERVRYRYMARLAKIRNDRERVIASLTVRYFIIADILALNNNNNNNPSPSVADPPMLTGADGFGAWLLHMRAKLYIDAYMFTCDADRMAYIAGRLEPAVREHVVLPWVLGHRHLVTGYRAFFDALKDAYGDVFEGLDILLDLPMVA